MYHTVSSAYIYHLDQCFSTGIPSVPLTGCRCAVSRYWFSRIVLLDVKIEISQYLILL